MCPLAEESPERRVAQSVVPVIHSPKIPHCFLYGSLPSYYYHETNAKWSSFLSVLKLEVDWLVVWVDFLGGVVGGMGLFWFVLFFIFICILTCSKSHLNLSRFLIWIKKTPSHLFPSSVTLDSYRSVLLASDGVCLSTLYSQELQNVRQEERKVSVNYLFSYVFTTKSVHENHVT